MALLRSLVSKKKKRFTEDGFDLDLSYITPRIIAMGFPSTGVEGIYRNPLTEVQSFFNKRHAGHYKVYNLCSERAYELQGLFDIVERFPFDDHNPCALKMIEKFCFSVDTYLAQHPNNVVGIHCKAGKGRTGLMIACYLLHSAQCHSAEAALEHFAKQRTMDNKGVTIPSQIRYVHYYEALLRSSEMVSYAYQIMSIRFNSVPNFDPSISGGGCDPYVVIKTLVKAPDDNLSWKKCNVFNQFEASGRHVQKYKPQDSPVVLQLEHQSIFVLGDTHMMFYDHDVYSADEKMCGLWFNTAFIDSNYLCFEKRVLDAAIKDKRNLKFDADFKLEIFFRRVD
ncbi:unnamed protein product, partial [Ectocarpus fasciculatus]